MFYPFYLQSMVLPSYNNVIQYSLSVKVPNPSYGDCVVSHANPAYIKFAASGLHLTARTGRDK